MPLTLEDVTTSAAEAHRAPPDPFNLVVFGASGDLAHRKLMPALFALACQGLLPEQARIIGFARSEGDDESFRASVRSPAVACGDKAADQAQWDAFAARLRYHRGGYDKLEDFESLRLQMDQDSAAGRGPANCLFYMATPPDAFVPIVRCLRESGLARRAQSGGPWARLIIEKPFGRDLPSAMALNAEIRSAFDESQIFRIDHYLGKETVQNLMVLRFANSLFEPVWNQKYVDHVQITVAEKVGVEARGGYYDQSGALRDMVQNHMMHILCLAAMEPPVSLAADAIRNEKCKVLQSLRPISPDCAANGVVRGQYAAGVVDGRAVPGYRQSPGVPPDSATETFVAFKAYVDNWRWSGVPFYLRTGKCLPARRTEVSIHFKSVPQVLFNAPPLGPAAPNVLAVRVQPDEGITMEFQVKVPGVAMRIQRLQMHFDYAEAFGRPPPDAYERLLLDAAVGDATLFTRDDEVEAAWRFVSPILEGCALQSRGRLHPYPAGTWGPKAAEALIAADGNRWHLVE